MNNIPSIFPFWHIALTAGADFVFSFAALWILQKRGYAFSTRTIVWLALAAGLSVLFWRSVGNVAQLNNDPIPPFSPNDLICPIFTFIFLEMAAAFYPPTSSEHWQKTSAWLTLVSFIVNVLFI